MRCVVINPDKRTITEEDLNARNWDDLREVIDCRLIEIFNLDYEKPNALYLDEEGRMMTPIPPAWNFGEVKFVGIGIIVGCKMTKTGIIESPCTIPLDLVKSKVNFDTEPAGPPVVQFKQFTTMEEYLAAIETNRPKIFR